MPRDPAVSHGNAQYARAHPFFVNIDCSLGRLLGLLYRKSAPLGIIDANTPLISLRLRSSALHVMLSVALKWLAGRTIGQFGRWPELVSLPDRGEVALFCFPDCVRLFDLVGSRVTTLCEPVETAARERLATKLAHQSHLAGLGLAPKVYEADEANGAYSEELCQGARLKTQQWWRPAVFEKINQSAAAIQGSSPPVQLRAGDRIRELRALVAALHRGRTDPGAHEWLSGEVDNVCEGVDPNAAMELFLSHGDLARRNILIRQDCSVVFIDWYTVDFRAKDYDIYNYHLSIAQDAADAPVSETRLFDYLHEALSRPDPVRAAEGLQRFILDFYLTRLKYFMPTGSTDASRAAGVLDQMRSYAACFARYRAFCTNTVPGGRTA